MNPPILCRGLLTALTAPETGELIYMPAGRHTITPHFEGKPITIDVEIEAGAAQAAEATRAALVSAGKKPLMDFHHDHRDASFWPQRFFWREGVGVIAAGEWSQAGKEAITGKTVCSFSPEFFVDNVKGKPARVIQPESCTPFMGSLVNNAAFREMPPFFAGDASLPIPAAPAAVATNNQNQNSMPEQNTAAAAENAAQQQHAEALKAKDAEIINLQAQLKERQKKDAEAAVQRGVARGAIAAQDADTIALLKSKAAEDPSLIAVIDKMPGHPVLAEGKVADNAVQAAAARVQLTQEDPVNVLKAYAGEGDSRKRGELYHRHIGPLLGKGAGLVGLSQVRGDKAITAENSFGTLVGNIIGQRTLELLRIQLPALNRITTDFSDQQVKYSQAIYTRYIGIPTVGTYNTSTGYPAMSTAAATDVYVTINQHKCIELDLQAEQLSGTARRLFDEQVPAMSYSLAKDLVDYVYALILKATFTNTVVTQTALNFGRPDIIDMGKALTDQGVPLGSAFRTLLLNTTYFAALAKDQAIVTLSAFQDKQIIEEGSLPNVHGFKVIEAPNLPTTGNMAGFGFSRSALVACTRLPIDYTSILPGASFGSVNTVTDVDTGAAMMQAMFVNHVLGTANYRLAWMYGASAGQVKAGQILTSA